MTSLQKIVVLLSFGLVFLGGCQQEKTSFRLLSPSETGVQFVNEITENDTLNILEVEFIYNGGGVAVGDLNGDDLEDIFFAGNQVDNALYLNRGEFKFEDISAAAGVQKNNPLFWSSGVNILDINLDGKLDIYVCNTLASNPADRRNLLYINQGNDPRGVPAFLEMGRPYGVADTSHSSHAQFFDYDNDGDLDLFIGVNLIEERYPSQFVTLLNDGSDPNRDNLFQNNWDETLGHPVFTDVSLEAGLVQNGYSHSTLIHDFNQDGWQDIYVANDYMSNDLIFINNQNGTFTNQAGKMFKHFSLSAMGADVADINNDGAADFFTSEMQPYYNKRKKLFQGGSSYQHIILTEQYDYEYQYTRNTLQLNLGMNPETNLPVFGEIGMYANVQETDWSWATLFADYDNDGWQDLYIANGFPKDVTDHDFGDFRARASNLVSFDHMYRMIPEVKSPNFLFRNRGDLTFENVSKSWGLDIPSFTNGAAYADLDNDGDLDLVTNNIDDPAFLFENTSNPNHKSSANNRYLRIKLSGADKNLDAFGASATIIHQGKKQKSFLLSGRGYLSKSENTLHFGLGSNTRVDSLIVNWPDGKITLLTDVRTNQVLELAYGEATAPGEAPRAKTAPTFTSVASKYDLLYKDEDLDFIDFNLQRTLPHKFSQYGPSVAVGDVNGDGLDDVFLGGSYKFEETWMIQQPDGRFETQKASYKTNPEREEEDAGSLLFDADGDGDLDLYIVRGSGQYPADDSRYQDFLCINDGLGQFRIAPDALPDMRANGSCVKAADFDADGDLDLFVGSRVLARGYPLADRSYLLQNDSRPGQPKFTDVTESLAPALVKPGLISDALWTDFNGDQWPDLILAGEWSPIMVFQNEQGRLTDVTAASGLSAYLGWWNSLAAADLDLDGDMDYIAGNFGENLYYRCTSEEPIRVYGKDLDDNGMVDPLISCYWQDSLGEKREYLYHPRQDLIKQFVGIRKKFNTYGEYGEATVSDMFTKEEMAGATILSANWMKTAVVENKGNGQFEIRALPVEAQLAPVYGILPYDFNGDDQLDLLLVGNDFGMEVQQGRADAFLGLALINKGSLEFGPLAAAQSHFTVQGDARGITSLISASGQELILATQNRDSLRVFSLARSVEKLFSVLRPGEIKALYYLKDGRKRIEEFYWGSGFMAQKGRYVVKTENVSKIELLDREGKIIRMID